MQSQSEPSTRRDQAPAARTWHSPQITDLRTAITRAGNSGALSDGTNNTSASIS